MPCEPVASGVPTPSRPSSLTNPSTSSLAFRMKRMGSGGARRALTALGTNDTKLNVRLAKSLLTISQDKFAKKWNFDPVREVPLGQGRFHWTATGSPSETQGSFGGASCSNSSMDNSSSCGLSLSSSSSHDLGAGAEAEDNAAVLRTCLSLPPGASPTTTPSATLPSHEPRVPPPHPEHPLCTAEPSTPTVATPRDGLNSSSRTALTPDWDARRKVPANIDRQGTGTEALKEPTSTSPAEPKATDPSSRISRLTAVITNDAHIKVPANIDKQGAGTEAIQDHKPTSPAEPTTAEPHSGISGLTAAGTSSDAITGVLVDKEPSPPSPLQDNNQCQRQIDPTDNRHQPSTASHTQAVITNYLRPRKRSSAHLQEAVHPSKTKKVLLAA